jgi:hypothetical protein
MRGNNMKKEKIWSTALAVALCAFLSLPAMAQKAHVFNGKFQAGAAATGTEEPCIVNTCVFYAGDFDNNGPNPNGLWNGNNTTYGITGTVYVPFTVPKNYKGASGKTDWNVQGLFVNEQMYDLTGAGYFATSADWSIVQGVAANGVPTSSKVKTICSGTAVPTLIPTGRIAYGVYPEYTILVTGIGCPILEAGTYWMTLVPTTEDLAYLSDVEDDTPPNAEGPGTEPVDDSFFYAPNFGVYSFEPAAPNACGTAGCDRFSAGVIGTAVH